MYEPTPLHAQPPITFLPLTTPSQKHHQNARATPIFFSDQYTIRSPVTKKPPSRNRTPRFASPQKTVHRPLPRRQPLCPFRPRGRQSVAAAAQRPYVLMFLCSSVFRVSGNRVPATASALMSLEANPDDSPWPSAAQRPYVSLMQTYVPYVFRGKRQARTSYLMFLCPYVLLSPALAASELPLGDSPSACQHINKQTKQTFMFFSILSQNIHPKTWHIHK